MTGLVLSLFPGIGLLDMAFEEEGFCIVRGPDLLWGGNIKTFHPPAGRFDGVIGGPPCQDFSELRTLNAALGRPETFGNLVPEFERVCVATAPAWFLMEQVPLAPTPLVPGYTLHDQLLKDHWCGGLTQRERRFSFGTLTGQPLRVETLALHTTEPERAVTGDARVSSVDERIRNKDRVGTTGGGVLPHAGKTLPLAEMCRLQGLPAAFLDHHPFTATAARKAVGNGVPMALGRAVAKAVRIAAGGLSSSPQDQRTSPPSTREPDDAR